MARAHRYTAKEWEELRTKEIDYLLQRRAHCGAYRVGNKWAARPMMQGQRVYLGLFATRALALAACREEREKVMRGGGS